MSDEPAAHDARLTDEHRYRLLSQALDIVGSLGRAAIWATVLGATAYWMHDVLLSFAGQNTYADVAIRLIADFNLGVALPYGAAAGGITYGLHQRRLRRITVRRLTARPLELEQRFDPQRTSSGLTPQGTTHPRDR